MKYLTNKDYNKNIGLQKQKQPIQQNLTIKIKYTLLAGNVNKNILSINILSVFGKSFCLYIGSLSLEFIFV